MTRIRLMRMVTAPQMTTVPATITPETREQITAKRRPATKRAVDTMRFPNMKTAPVMRMVPMTAQMMVPGRNNRGILFFMGHKSGNFDVFFKIFVKK